MGIIDDYKAGRLMNEVKQQIPFAIAKALNEVAVLVKDAEKREMEKVFDNPTPYTLNSVFFKKATKQKFEVNIIIRNEAAKGTPPVKYLEPQIFGGTRRAKSSERQLREKGLIEDNMFWAAGQKAKLDRYGNVSPGQIVQILSALKAFREVGYVANRSANGRTRNPLNYKKKNKQIGTNIFVQKEWGQSLYPGVYKRIKRDGKPGVEPLLVFLENPQFKERFNFFRVGEEIYDKEFENKFNETIQYALATAR